MRKILISSDPNGRFDLLLPKVAQLHNKNKFDFMIITGSVCPVKSSSVFKQLANHKLSFCLPTYFIDNSEMSTVFSISHPDGFQVVPNLYYLGNSGYKDIKGTKIAYMSGIVKNAQSIKQSNQFYFTKSDAKKFIDQNLDKQIDILLTNQWAEQYSPIQGCTPSRNQTNSQICYQLSPRYHLSSGGSKYLRLPPFKGRKGNPTHFINVAQIKQNLPKDKYLVAIQLNPQVPQILQNIADNPLVKNVEWNVVSSQEPKNKYFNKPTQKKSTETKVLDKNSFILFQGFPQETPNSQITEFLQRWGEIKQLQVFKKLKNNKKSGIVKYKNLSDAEICLKDSGKYTMYQSRIKFQIKYQNEKYNLKDCFLCQGNEKFDNSLLIYKAKFCFICVDKGPITQNHFQIVPINHVSSTSQLEREQQQQITKIKTIYQNYFTSQGYGFICIQRYMNLSSEINHAILHCIPIKMGQQQILTKFKQVTYESRHGFDEIGSKNLRDNKSPYYIIFQINNKKFVKYVQRKDKRFEQGRQIVCQIIEKPQKLNWRDCQLKPQQLRRTVQKLKIIVL